MSTSRSGPACRRMEWLDPFYKAVWEKAYADAIPISGTFELTPRCNFNCRMCYVHLPDDQIALHGTEMNAKEWIRIAGQAKEAGTTWLCITGGEPLVHPEFAAIWRELARMGFFITLQTNASLLKTYEKLFEEYPPRACKITIYGSDDEVYQRVCRTEKGFTKVDEGIRMLKEMKIPVELVSTVIRQNMDDVEQVIAYAGKNRLPWIPNLNVRTAGRGVDVDMERLRIRLPQGKRQGENTEEKNSNAVVDTDRKPCTYCRDYRLGYWIVWNGYMRFCSFMNGPDIPVRDRPFKECWDELVAFEDGLQWPRECRECEYAGECRRCAALFDIENGTLKVRQEFCRKRKE